MKTVRKQQAEYQPDLDKKRHSLAHLLAIAVLKKFPEAQLGIGPTIENGFYYDFKLPRPLPEEDLPELEKTMREVIAKELPFKGEKITPQKARSMFKHQPFKLDLIKEFSKDKKQLTAYYTGCTPTSYKLQATSCFVDLCRGGHVKNTREIHPNSFKLTKVAGAYWRGDEKNLMLTRIYGVAFETKEELDRHLAMLEEAKRRDHKKLGVELDLFTFSELVGPGLPLWTPKGTLVRDLLDDFVSQLRKERGYDKVEIPHITKKDLYERSGHWEKFKDDLFRITTREGHEFAMKPMNCPHHTQIYNRRLWSYRDLPQRYANTTMVYRDEQSGELAGLSRVRSITQDDAHVFCRKDQVREEFEKIWDIVNTFYGTFGFTLRVRLSFHDPKQKQKYLGSPALWKTAESELRAIAKARGVDAIEAIGEAAFYGPKVDFMAQDSLGREWQVATIQLDMNQPERFDLVCINEKGERERIVMIHAAIMGAIERFLSILIEHTAGTFPVWLSPVQVAILPISEKQIEYANKIRNELSQANMRTELFDANETLGKRIRETEMQKIPYLLIVGDKEIQTEAVSVRARGKGDLGQMKIQTFIQQIEEEIRTKK